MKYRQALRMAWRLPCSRTCSLKLSKGKARLIFQDTYTLGKNVIDKLLTAETGAKDESRSWISIHVFLGNLYHTWRLRRGWENSLPLLFIEVQLIYNTVLVSSGQHSNSGKLLWKTNHSWPWKAYYIQRSLDTHENLCYKVRGNFLKFKFTFMH